MERIGHHICRLVDIAQEFPGTCRPVYVKPFVGPLLSGPQFDHWQSRLPGQGLGILCHLLIALRHIQEDILSLPKGLYLPGDRFHLLPGCLSQEKHGIQHCRNRPSIQLLHIGNSSFLPDGNRIHMPHQAGKFLVMLRIQGGAPEAGRIGDHFLLAPGLKSPEISLSKATCNIRVPDLVAAHHITAVGKPL